MYERSDQPVNLCGAFEKPVVSEEGGYAQLAAKRLTEYRKMIYTNYAAEPETELILSEELPLPMLLKELEQAVVSALGGDEK